MAYSSEIKKYAKELFLTIDSDGNHQYSYDEIIQQIQQKFNNIEKYPDKSTITRWANKKDKDTKKSWNDIWKSGIKSGITQSNINTENKRDADEKFEVHIDKITRLRAENAIKIQQNFKEKLDEDDVEYQDIAEMKLSETIFNNLNLELSDENVNKESILSEDEMKAILEDEGYLDDTEENKDISNSIIDSHS